MTACLEPLPLPCPFCGGRASLSAGQQAGTRDHGYRWIRCGTCHAQSGGYRHDTLTETIRAATAAWNRRTP